MAFWRGALRLTQARILARASNPSALSLAAYCVSIEEHFFIFMSPMSSTLKRKLFGDQRPIEREIDNDVLGPLEYSSDDEAWLARESSGRLQFGFYICGSDDFSTPTQMPDPALVRQAECVALDQDRFVADVMAYVREESRTKRLHKGWESEIAQLKIETLCLFWPKRPRDGQIYFSGGANYRLWRCGYLDGAPGGGLGFDS
jgi:hypothetical protein